MHLLASCTIKSIKIAFSIRNTSRQALKGHQLEPGCFWHNSNEYCTCLVVNILIQAHVPKAARQQFSTQNKEFANLIRRVCRFFALHNVRSADNKFENMCLKTVYLAGHFNHHRKWIHSRLNRKLLAVSTGTCPAQTPTVNHSLFRKLHRVLNKIEKQNINYNG